MPMKRQNMSLNGLLFLKKGEGSSIFHPFFSPMLKINLISEKLMKTEMFEQEVNY